MDKRLNNKGMSLMELIIAVTIMGVLIGVLTPTLIRHSQKAKQVKVEKEASEFVRAAQVAYAEVCGQGNEPLGDTIKHKTKSSSPYYRGGTLYANLTNWTVHNGTVAGASNGPFADAFFETLGISYGTGWKNGSSTIPISEKQPKLNPSGSTTKECVFQVFYTEEGSIVVEYSRNGYFVRMENNVLVDSIKIKNDKQSLFTTWQ